MRVLVLLGAAVALGGCMIPVHPADKSSQEELERQAREGCNTSPNSDDWLACRRRTQDSWRNPADTRTPPDGIRGADT